MDDYIGILIAGFVSVFVLAICLMCGIFCIAFWRKRNNNALYSSPVVITGQAHQPPGQPIYPVSVQSTQNLESQTMTHPPNPQMPQPSSLYPPQNTQMPLPYPTASQPQFPLPNQLPYPPQDSTNFPQPSSSSNDLRDSNNERIDDLPPSYHKIDKL
ncbi:uncharacterized protein [Chironomus tepperi]|uniref:uncharacterized protein n=1 Tax=Chironomus tepperi TaxID=113505 RepID=UPI00391F4312